MLVTSRGLEIPLRGSMAKLTPRLLCGGSVPWEPGQPYENSRFQFATNLTTYLRPLLNKSVILVNTLKAKSRDFLPHQHYLSIHPSIYLYICLYHLSSVEFWSLYVSLAYIPLISFCDLGQISSTSVRSSFHTYMGIMMAPTYHS